MRRRKRSARFGLAFFGELIMVGVLSGLTYVAFKILTGKPPIAIVAAVVIAIGLLISPLCTRLVRGVFRPWSTKQDAWHGYYKD